MSNTSTLLDSRSANVLKAVVESYIEHSEPVSARSVARKYDFNLSPATIRNVMADLKRAGFLDQPHTSAGSVPSDAGYRLYAEALIEEGNLPVIEKKNICMVTFGPELRQIADMFSSVTKTLASLSHQTGLAGLTSWTAAPIKKIRFAHIEDDLALAVIISTGGEMRSQLIKTDEPFDQDTLDKLSNFFNDRFSGLTLLQIRRRLMNEIHKEKDHVDTMISCALLIAERIEERVSVEMNETIYVDGASNLISPPEAPMDLSRVKALFKTLDEKSKLVSLLNECLKSDGINLMIGSESAVEELRDFSLVTHAFSGSCGAIGSVGIIGPKSMDYSHVMALVAYTARQVSRRLAGQSVEIIN